MTPKDWIDSFQVLVNFITGVAWPAVFVIFVWLFRTEVRHLLARVQSWKGFGQEVQLQENLEELNTEAVAAGEATPALPFTPGSEEASRATAKVDASVEKVLEVAASSPTAALLLLSAEIEKQIRELLALMGLLVEEPRPSLFGGVELLNQRGTLPRHVSSSLKLFRTVRNEIVHGRHATHDDVFAALDSGIAILRALYAVPAETHLVVYADVPVYADSKVEQKRDDVHGVILESTSPGGSRKYRRIFPTTRPYKAGESVAWEWNTDKSWSDSWYRDPETQTTKSAWNGSAEFVGRNLDTL